MEIEKVFHPLGSHASIKHDGAVFNIEWVAGDAGEWVLHINDSSRDGIGAGSTEDTLTQALHLYFESTSVSIITGFAQQILQVMTTIKPAGRAQDVHHGY